MALFGQLHDRHPAPAPVDSPLGGRPPSGAVTLVPSAADVSHMMLQTTVYAAARSRAHGPTAALWHAVEVHRPTAEVDGACELTLCGSLAPVTPDVSGPTGARRASPPATAAAPPPPPPGSLPPPPPPPAAFAGRP